jgi:hypothetical protein
MEHKEISRGPGTVEEGNFPLKKPAVLVQKLGVSFPPQFFPDLGDFLFYPVGINSTGNGHPGIPVLNFT